MKTRLIVFLVLACAICFTIYSHIHSDREWQATKRRNLQSALEVAARDGDLPTVRSCVEAGADPTALPLDWVAAWGSADVILYLLDHGVNPNGTKGRSPLIHLCYVGHVGHLGADVRIARLLLERGADPNVCEEGLQHEKLTPLKGAKLSGVLEKTGNAELITLLQQYGAHE